MLCSLHKGSVNSVLNKFGYNVLRGPHHGPHHHGPKMLGQKDQTNHKGDSDEPPTRPRLVYSMRQAINNDGAKKKKEILSQVSTWRPC